MSPGARWSGRSEFSQVANHDQRGGKRSGPKADSDKGAVEGPRYSYMDFEELPNSLPWFQLSLLLTSRCGWDFRSFQESSMWRETSCPVQYEYRHALRSKLNHDDRLPGRRSRSKFPASKLASEAVPSPQLNWPLGAPFPLIQRA